MTGTTQNDPVGFACPKCKSPLRSIQEGLKCRQCGRTYPIEDGISDFLSGDSPANLARILDMAKKRDLIAPNYEAPLWHSMILRLSGTAHTSIHSIADFYTRVMNGVSGAVLDVACGSATYSRHLASPSRSVYGIDISIGMLRQGSLHIVQEGISGMRLARACAEELPFIDASFDGVICSGAFYLFSDMALALREIARVMKPGALLAGQTVVATNTKTAHISKGRQDIHALEIVELRRRLTQAGLEEFHPQWDGPSLTFSVYKRCEQVHQVSS